MMKQTVLIASLFMGCSMALAQSSGGKTGEVASTSGSKTTSGSSTSTATKSGSVNNAPRQTQGNANLNSNKMPGDKLPTARGSKQ